MTSSRDRILNKLRAANKPFPDAPPRPKAYQPVTSIDDTSPEGLITRFSFELDRVAGQAFPVEGDAAAREKVLELLRQHNTTHIISWLFRYIPVEGMEQAIRDTGINIIHPEMHDEFRAEVIESIRIAEVGLTGADAAVATTGTLIVSTAPGKGRLPTVLAPVHLAVITIDQLIPRLENWINHERANGLPTIQNSANVCFITGSSRTADIEMEPILGVHGPGKLYVVIKK